ncbi:MAG: hypothetical protein ACUZ8O_14945 [Candidatus Anammoxibacter sp.]
MTKPIYIRFFLLAYLLLLSRICLGGEIGFIEKFSLAPDRSVPLNELILGTEDYYYYHALHYQNSGKLSEVENILKQWIKRYGYTDKVEEIRNRQALLMYETNPQHTLSFLKERLGLHFNHQKIVPDRKFTFPTVLDQNIISRETLSRKAFKQYRGLQGFEDSALDFLVSDGIDKQRRRELLHRIKRPDYPKLPEMVVADLQYKHSSGFGSHEIHKLMLLDQLKRCGELTPELFNNSKFVNAILEKLLPNSEVNVQYDKHEMDAYLDRLQAFVKPLGNSFNSLKAHALYNRLIFDETLGIYDKDVFIEYIKLPKNVFYINRRLKNNVDYKSIANLNENYASLTVFPPIETDSKLVKRYLSYFFIDMDSSKEFAPYIDDTFLNECFAETKIVNGLGDMEEWYSMLPPEKHNALKERVDVEFSTANKTIFTAKEDVELNVSIKNVTKLIVKIFHINTINYYRSIQHQVGIDMNLDGLVANEEHIYKYNDPPLRKIKRSFKFDSLKRPGVYIVEFVGNGKSSRAVIQKGTIKYVENIGSAGHEFALFDEDNHIISNGSIILSGHEYKADKDGRIIVPFTNKPGRQQIILVHDEFASLDYFNHKTENYTFVAGIYVDREALLKNKNAKVFVRPVLYLNNEPITISLLEDISLIIESVDPEGVRSTKKVVDFKLYEDQESVYEFQTQENLANITFILKAKVQNLLLNKKIDLSVEKNFRLNNIDTTEQVYDIHLSYIDNEYIIDLIGKNGEEYSGMPVTIELKHKHFRNNISQLMQTNKQGRINIGKLKDITYVTASMHNARKQKWILTHDSHSYPLSIHCLEGETIKIPYMGKAVEAKRSMFSFLEKRGNGFVKDWFDRLVIDKGFLEINSIPAGTYDLLIKESDTRIKLIVAKGKLQNRHFLSNNRCIGSRNPEPLQISGIDQDKNRLKISLANNSDFTRVHVVATRFTPDYSIFSSMGGVYSPEPDVRNISFPTSLYHSGRNIGDEVSYILNRKYSKKYPGNMLKRPALLLNPMRLQKTETGKDTAGLGDQLKGRRETPQMVPSESEARKSLIKTEKSFTNLDFLADSSVLLTNLRPDSDGTITLDMKQFSNHNNIYILAIDPLNTVYRRVSLREGKMALNDLRLKNALDPDKHYTGQKQISIVGKGVDFTIADITTSKFELFDTISKVYGLYSTLANDAKLKEFNFILDWPKLDGQVRLEKYSEYACHELNFFIYKKDKKFFNTVIVPYLRNKKDKTFLDHWLLMDDLTVYLKPWHFSRLNIVEKILLGKRITNKQKFMQSYINDLFDTIPPDIDKFNFYFKTALGGSALDTGDDFGIKRAKNERLKQLAVGGAMDRMAEMAAISSVSGRSGFKAVPASKRKLKALKGSLELEKKDFDDKEYDENKSSYYNLYAKERRNMRQFYRKLDKTQEWVENNYYLLPIDKQDAGLVTVNAFWNDYAQLSKNDLPFYSKHLALAAGNFTEIMFALSVLDLPFEKGIYETKIEGSKFTLNAKDSLVVFHEEIKEAEMATEKADVIVSQNFFKYGERYLYVGHEQRNKYITDNFIVSTVYGCNVIVSNPSSLTQKLDILLQIPKGTLPVKNGFYTRSVSLELQPYETESLEYYFYFPIAGSFPHYPLHAAKDQKILANASPYTFHVTEKPVKKDVESWDYISQQGSNSDVIKYLSSHNLNRTVLEKIAFRMRDKNFFKKTTELLMTKHFYNSTLWSYGVYHNDANTIRDYLQNSSFLVNCGLYLDSGLATIDPVERRTYQHMEYSPLVNPRAHFFGKKRKILNERFYDQYQLFMKILSYKQKLDDNDLIAISYAMLLQDRVDEAFTYFKQIKHENVQTKLQYEYLKAYLAFYSHDYKTARSIASQYTDYPVIRWRNLFANAINQLDEIEGAFPKAVDTEDRSQIQATLAATEPVLDFKVEAKQVTLNYKNITECEANYYLMDIELLFSRNPFVRQYSNQFSNIKPNHNEQLVLQPDKSSYIFNLPEKFNNSNVMIEIVSGSLRKTQTYFTHALDVQLIENYGQVKVVSGKDGQPISGVYVKVYAKLNNEEVIFYKDGYTDPRGMFDYSSLSTDELNHVKKFSLLIISDSHGSVIREASPPKM